MCYSVSSVTTSMVKGQVDVVFLDFAKAFDRVAHDILLQKLCNFGISAALLNWCKDYFTDREQSVAIDSIGRSSGFLIGPVVLRNFYKWFA